MKIIFASVFTWLWFAASAGEITTTYWVTNTTAYSMTASFAWTIKVNGTVVAQQNPWANNTVNPGSAISLGIFQLNTNDTCSVVWDAAVYYSNNVPINVPGGVNGYWDGASGSPYSGSYTANGGPGGSWVNQTSQGLFLTLVPIGGSLSCSYNVSSVAPAAGEVPMVAFSDGEVFGPYPIALDGTINGYFPHTPFAQSYENMPCGLTWQVDWIPCTFCNGNADGGGTTNMNNPGLLPLTNAIPTGYAGQPNDQTNAPLATVPPDTSSNLLWSSPGSSSPATSQDIHDLGNGLNNTLWTANQQQQDDDSAVVGAINAAKALAHSDALNGLTTARGAASQAHSDALAIVGQLQTLTNSGVGVNLTNYALNSTLLGVLSAIGTNNGILESNLPALTGLSAVVSNLETTISNAMTWTNLDIASETTLEGISNLLQNGGTNFGRVVTNYALETTQEGISNVLSQILSNALAGGTNLFGTNGLTLAQLTNQVNAYTTQLTNSEDGALAQMSALTNQASVMGMNPVVSAVQGLPGNVEYDAPGGVSPQVITLASGVSFSLGSNMPSYGPLRQVLAWATIAGLFLWNWRTTYSKIRDVFTANQARTSGTEILGSNVNLSSALLMAVAIFAAATAIPTFAVAVLTDEVTLFFSVGTPSTLFSGFGWGYSFLDQYIPLATVISAVTSRVVFNVAIDSIAAVVMGIKLFLVGL